VEERKYEVAMCEPGTLTQILVPVPAARELISSNLPKVIQGLSAYISALMAGDFKSAEEFQQGTAKLAKGRSPPSSKRVTVSEDFVLNLDRSIGLL
jgi:hypothetical protein